ncbi:MAG: TlyA family RNA methyltransferase [Spirochaetia bacterium]|jgi:23S rRNA (cytidine1920-2'-O)/16S rRNA (cytidine1409-2'-O)-methyltransferase
MGARKITLITLLKTRYPTLNEKELFAAILRGDVIVAGEKVVKPGVRVQADASVRMRGRSRYVSRGGEKLAEALDQWSIPCSGLVWIDAGCSTGGFTDCLLQRGAALVYAVDVGDGQLDWRLRGDPRVRPMEGTNIMALSRADLHPLPEGAVADLSFRSLRGAARHILGLTSGGWGIFLVKPQFELRTPTPDFHGVVRDQAVVRAILRDLAARLAEEGVFAEKALSSPIKGRKGNKEFLFFLRAGRDVKGPDADEILSGLVLE